MTETNVPKVDLLDINHDPTDVEMTTLMQDMVNTANAKWEKAQEAYTADLCAAIDEAAREGAENARRLQHYLSATHADTLGR